MRLYDIAFYAALFFILGVGAASFELNVWLFSVLAIILGFALPTILTKSAIADLVSMVLIAVFIFAGFLGFFYYHFYVAFQSENIVFNKEVVFRGEVVREAIHGLKTEEVESRASRVEIRYRG